MLIEILRMHDPRTQVVNTRCLLLVEPSLRHRYLNLMVRLAPALLTPKRERNTVWGD